MAKRGPRRKKRGVSERREPLLFYDHRVDFHGYQPHEAWRELEELVYVSERQSILVVHGRGDGILRDYLREQLRHCPFVARMVPGENANVPGGDGVTVVYAK